jgi:hypothetical protein
MYGYYGHTVVENTSIFGFKFLILDVSLS